jgi:hypothetical protein
VSPLARPLIGRAGRLETVRLRTASLGRGRGRRAQFVVDAIAFTGRHGICNEHSEGVGAPELDPQYLFRRVTSKGPGRDSGWGICEGRSCGVRPDVMAFRTLCRGVPDRTMLRVPVGGENVAVHSQLLVAISRPSIAVIARLVARSGATGARAVGARPQEGEDENESQTFHGQHDSPTRCTWTWFRKPERLCTAWVTDPAASRGARARYRAGARARAPA